MRTLTCSLNECFHDVESHRLASRTRSRHGPVARRMCLIIRSLIICRPSVDLFYSDLQRLLAWPAQVPLLDFSRTTAEHARNKMRQTVHMCRSGARRISLWGKGVETLSPTIKPNVDRVKCGTRPAHLDFRFHFFLFRFYNRRSKKKV